MTDVDPVPVPEPEDDEQEQFFVEEDPVASTLEAEVDPSDYDPRTMVDDPLPGVDAHLDDAADAIHDLLD